MIKTTPFEMVFIIRELMKRKVLLFSCICICIAVLLISPLIWILSASKFRNAEKLIDAIEAENIEQIEELLDSGIDPNQANIPVSNYWTIFEFSARRPLSIACGTGNIEIVTLLIEYGATAEYIEYTGWSPLGQTLLQTNPNDLEMVQLLLSNGADPTIVESGENAVFAAAFMRPAMFGDEGYATGYDENAAEMITKIVDLLLSDGDVNSLSPYGNTLLMHAAQRGNLKLIRYLIDRGCCLSTKNSLGQTAYDVAIESNKMEAAELLKTE